MDSNKGSNSNSLDLDSFLKNINAKQKPQQNSLLKYFHSEKAPIASSKESQSQPIAPKEALATQPKEIVPQISVKDKEMALIPLPKQTLSIEELLVNSREKIIPDQKTKLETFSDRYRINPGCKFCDIIHHKKDKIIWEDEICTAFHDKKKITAQEHILMCSKNHIRNSHCISKDNIPLLIYLEEAGQALLSRLRPESTYRFGYHEPPMNSIDHLHLHCIVLPITSKYLDQVIYGFKLASTQKIISKIMYEEIIPGIFPEKPKKEKGKDKAKDKSNKLDDIVDIIDDDNDK